MKNKTIKQEKTEKQVNIESKKLTKKRWIWLTLSIGLVSIAVIVTIIVSLNFKSNPTPTLTPNYEGVHYNNYSESIVGDPAPLPPMVKYSIDVEKDNYAYDQEFIIKYTIGGLRNLGGYDYYIEPCNDLNVKIVSEQFEFLSPTEYHFDLETDISTYGNILSFGNEEKDSIFPIEIELKVKATKQNDTIDHILFLLDVPLRDYYKERLKEFYAEEEGYKYDFDEFTKDFEWVHKFYFLNDELGTLLVDMNKRIDYYDTLYKRMSYINAYNEIIYRSLNRLYEKELITKQDYIKRLTIHFTNKRTSLDYRVESHNQDKYIVSYKYYSRNLRVDFDLNDEYDYLYELCKKDQESRIQVTKILLKILYDESKITLEEYNNEIAILDEEGLLDWHEWQEFIGQDWTATFKKYNSILVPFKDYEDYYFDMHIGK